MGTELNSWLYRLVTKLRNPPVSVFLLLCQGTRCAPPPSMPNFYVGAGYLNSSPHANMTRTLLTEPSPQSLFDDLTFENTLSFIFSGPVVFLNIYM